MSDAVIDQTQDAAAVDTNADVALDTNTYAVTKDATGKIGFGIYKEGNTLAKAIDEGKVEIVFKCDVSIPYAVTLAGTNKILEDEQETITLFNNGLNQKAVNRVKAYLTETDKDGNFTHADETTLDATEFAASPMKRQTLTEAQKLQKALSGASQADILAVLKAMNILV